MTAALVHHATREAFADPGCGALSGPREMDGDNPYLAGMVGTTQGQLWTRLSDESERKK